VPNHYYKVGEWNVTCDVCSKKIKAGEARKRWDGFIVCPDDYEIRHPQDFVKARQDKISVPFTRPIPTDIFIGPACYPIYVQDGYWANYYTEEERTTYYDPNYCDYNYVNCS